jgi:uncharacterized protein YjbI with pentapeptide repeats
VPNTSYNVSQFKVFICYKEENGNLFAELTRLVLLKGGIKSFVAHIERNKHAEDFDEMRRKLLDSVPFFIFINTLDALSSLEVAKEFKMAFPDGKINGIIPIIIHFKVTSRRPTSSEIKEKTGVEIPKYKNIPSFKDEDELVDLISNLCQTYEITHTKISRNSIKKELQLIKYLKYCYSLSRKENALDKKTLADMYIPNHCRLSEKKTWNLDDDTTSLINDKDWCVNEFLESSERYIVIGAPYGIGKTYFSFSLASNLAAEALRHFSSAVIPIHIPMRFKFNRIDDKGNNLESILSLVPRQRKIVLIFDGLDEFGDEHKIRGFYKFMIGKLTKYPKSKSIVTTRLNSNTPDILNFDYYVRMLGFDNNQINQFFQKYNISLKADKISKSGLGPNEIGKPLFCNMISILYERKKKIIMSERLFLNRTLLFFEIIHSIILGKHVKEADNYGHRKHHLDEKNVLRKIAELKYIYEDKLTKQLLLYSIKRSNDRINTNILEVFERLITTYFYKITANNYEERIDFIHKSFVEYLLAEFYISCLLVGKPNIINMKSPKAETIQFVTGLLELIRSKNKVFGEYQKRLSQFFSIDSSDHLLASLMSISVDSFNNDSIRLNNSRDYPDIIEPYENISVHRWFSLFVLNKLGKEFKPDKIKFIKLLKSTQSNIPDYLINLNNIDLSESEFDFDMPNLILINAKLRKSKFHGTFFGTKFSGADLTDAYVDTGTKFLNCDFSGSNLTRLNVSYETEYAASFRDCNFSKCNLVNAKMRWIDFRGSDFYEADLSGADISNSIFSMANLSKIKFDGNTNTKNIQFLGKEASPGYNKQWEQLKSNHELISSILSDLDPDFREKLLSDNPDLRQLQA